MASGGLTPRLRWLRAFDRRFGSTLLRLAPGAGTRGGPVPPRDVRRLLLIRPGGLGDAALTWPLLHLLRSRFPHAPLTVLGERRNIGVYRLGNPVDTPDTLCYDDGSLPTWRRLRAAGFDLVIDTEQYHHLSTLLAAALRPRWLAGFASAGRARVLTHAVRHDEDRYAALGFLDLGAALTGEAPTDLVPGGAFIPLQAEHRAHAVRLLAPVVGRRPVLSVMAGAGGAYRQWPIPAYVDLVRGARARDLAVALIGGPDAVPTAAAIVAGLGADAMAVLNLAGRTTLAVTAGVLAISRACLSPDTGILHLAAGLGVPTIGLFGSGRHRQWAPTGAQHHLVRLDLPCSPCTTGGRTPPCPIDIACMRELTALPVLRALDALLAAPAAPSKMPPS